MYLNIMKNKKTGKVTLSIRRGYRDANGKVKNTTIEYLGDLETLKNEYDDPIAHFKEVVNKMNQEEKASKYTNPHLVELVKRGLMKTGRIFSICFSYDIIFLVIIWRENIENILLKKSYKQLKCM